MTEYKVILSDYAKQQIQDAKRYIKLRTKSQDAVKNFCKDISETKNSLKRCADSLAYYNRRRKQKSIHLKKHKYKFIYSVEGNIAIIESF